MKPRVITPYKVLAVAAASLASAACGKVTADEQAQGPARASAEVVEAAPGPVLAAPEAPVVSKIPDDRADPKLLLLRAELDGETAESARAKQAHYRPLCDKDGYPLVGNVNRKGPAGPRPSQFCAEVREKKATPS